MPDTTATDSTAPVLTADQNAVLMQIVQGYVRHGLTLAAGWLISHGLIAKSDESIFIGSMLALGGVLWSTGQKLAVQKWHSLALMKAAADVKNAATTAAAKTPPAANGTAPTAAVVLLATCLVWLTGCSTEAVNGSVGVEVGPDGRVTGGSLSFGVSPRAITPSRSGKSVVPFDGKTVIPVKSSAHRAIQNPHGQSLYPALVDNTRLQ